MQDRTAIALIGWETRRLYRFETECEILKPLRQRQSLDSLRHEAKKIWKTTFFRQTHDIPELRFGPGTKHGTEMVSFYHWYDNYSEFAPGERNYLVLSHELVHAKGYEYHNQGFVAEYFKVLDHHFDIDLKELSYQAEVYDLPYQPMIH
jgi:hypothetical protein